MVRPRIVGLVALFVYASLTLVPVAHGQFKTAPLKITVYKTPT